MPSRRFEIQIAASAARALRKLDQPTRKRLARQIESLAADPRPHGAKKLAGEPNLYRVRSRDHRIIYTVQDRVLIILVVAIGHRRDIYRRS
ncbi:MAG: type II toxin-antitoxin system RelE/ParE family toxin [Gemmatimonadaceae bacterium]|nr:type II toxin-antitoxin system RelE/ParE family toxin [Gemmatimonadaceae bacterium]